MNDRLRDGVMQTPALSAASRVPLLKEEPLFSYVTRIDVLTAGSDRRRVLLDLLGSPGFRLDCPLHGGYEFLARRLSSDGLISGQDLVPQHSLLPVFKPFANPSRYRHMFNLVSRSDARGGFQYIGARSSGVFRRSPACCLDCLAADTRDRVPPHYRRPHMLAASVVCAEHGTPVTTGCEACGAPLRHNRLPSATCDNCGALLQPGRLPVDLDASLAQKLAKLIQSCLNGELPAPDEPIRLAALRERVRARVRNRSGLVGDNLATFLIRTYGRPFLEELQLVPDAPPALGWPSLMIHGKWWTSDPITNILLIAALFESVADYSDAIATCSSDLVVPVAKCRELPAGQRVTVRMLRDILGPRPLSDIAERHNANVQSLRPWVAAYPGLAERRRQCGARIELRRSKRKILEYIAGNPGCLRNQVESLLQRDVARVRQSDMPWLDRHLPVQQGL